MRANADDSELKLVFLGDSLTAGFGVGEHLAFPAIIKERLTKKGVSTTVLNAGVSGDTSAGGLRRIRWVLRGDVDVVVIALGANDMLRGQPPKATRANLEEMISLVRSTKPEAKIILAGIKALPSMGSAYGEEFEAIYGEIAKAKGVTLIPHLLEGVAGEEEMNQADMIHPNEMGQAKIAETVLKYLEPVLKLEADILNKASD